MHRSRIAVLRGGSPYEYTLSLKTGGYMLRALEDHGDVLDIVITKAGEWLLRGVSRSPKDILSQVDVVCVAVHGTREEDGSLQQLLDRFGVRYTGSRALATKLATHKAMTKDRLLRHGVLMPQHMIITRSALDNLSGTVASLVSLFGTQCVIKPVTGGSSAGTIYCENALMLEKGLRTALSVYPEVLVEEYIVGREATCGVIESYRAEPLYALPPVLIEKDSPILRYEDKCQGTFGKVCPAPFTLDEKREMERIARLAHQELGLSHYSKSDFVIGKNGIYFLEVNTHPDLSDESAFVYALDVVGSSFSEFFMHLLTLAERRQRPLW